MSYILPATKLVNRTMARRFMREKEKVDKILLPIEHSFCELVLNDNNHDYNDLYSFHLEYFNKALKVIDKNLKYSIVNYKYFEQCYKSVV